jgi:polysaccharide export outer membrane protein
MKSGNSPLQVACAVLALVLSAATLVAQQPAGQQPETPAGATTPGQTPGAIPAQPNGPALTIRNEKMLESFQPSTDEEYTLGAGDEISLEFPGHADLNRKMVVGPDGMISISPAGAIHVIDLTRDGAAQAIKKSLATYYNDLSVTVSIDKYSSNRVQVLGYVQHPGAQFFEGPPTLLDAIGKAGMITPQVTANGAQTNTGNGIPEMCTVYRDNSTAVQVQLRDLLLKGDILANLRLRRNDIVYVPQPEELFVSVIGQVSKPGTIPLTRQSTLTSILAEAGCCSDNGGFNPKIHIIQPSTQKDFQISYKDVMTLAGQQEYKLHSGDVIIVPMSGFSKFSSVVQKVGSAATMVSLAAFIGAR